MNGFPERDAAIDAVLPHVPEHGFTRRAMRLALRDIGADPNDADMLFPGGSAELVEAFLELADRRMETAAAAQDLSGQRLTARIRTLIALRLAQAEPHKAAVQRAASWMALPGHAAIAARCTARTVDAIWHAAGDTSADFSWYTKRAILAAIYSATLLYWLRDGSPESADTLAFLDRRLTDLGRISKFRRARAA
jgi:ubiquinone biosynthesis protein COQ9